MFAQLNIYKNAIMAGLILFLILGLYFYISGLKSDISELKLSVSKWQVKSINAERESEMLRNSLTRQTQAVEALKVDKAAALDKLSKWKEKPVTVKYKTIYKVVTKPSNKCKDIKKSLNNIRQINFDDL